MSLKNTARTQHEIGSKIFIETEIRTGRDGEALDQVASHGSVRLIDNPADHRANQVTKQRTTTLDDRRQFHENSLTLVLSSFCTKRLYAGRVLVGMGPYTCLGFAPGLSEADNLPIPEKKTRLHSVSVNGFRARNRNSLGSFSSFCERRDSFLRAPLLDLFGNLKMAAANGAYSRSDRFKRPETGHYGSALRSRLPLSVPISRVIEQLYYVTNLDPSKISAFDLMRLIRRHLQVENCLHFVKDRSWDENRHWTRRPGLGAVFAALTNAAIPVLRVLPDSESILRARTEKIQWNSATALKLLGF